MRNFEDSLLLIPETLLELQRSGNSLLNDLTATFTAPFIRQYISKPTTTNLVSAFVFNLSNYSSLQTVLDSDTFTIASAPFIKK